MTIERTDKEIIFRLPSDIDTESLQRILDYLKFRESVKDSVGTEEQSNLLADELKKVWWKEYKHRYIN